MLPADPTHASKRVVFLSFAFATLSTVGCSAPGGPESAKSWIDAGSTTVPDGQTMQALEVCKPAKSSENLAPRVDVLAAVGTAAKAAGPRMVQVSELFQRFNTLCGVCHVATGNGGKQTSAATFPTTFDDTWLAAITSNDPTKAMPPSNMAYSARPPTDSVVQLVTLLQPWLAQGRPVDMFTVTDDGSASAGMTDPTAGTVTGYAYSSMTNLGDCIPPAADFANSSSDEMTAKDAVFAAATQLPMNLSDTDLTTFDADVLATNGVVAYVPTYPLWSDGSGKLRHIRVPKGTSVKFNKDTQTFDIPPNTRFYKTFFRQVVDGAGNQTNRKIETRLIVTRPDTIDTDGKSPLPTALFGTYMWSEDELTATLADIPYRDGTGFADQTLSYVTDEIAYHEIVDALGPGSGSVDFSDRLTDALAKQPNVVQHYAVPGSLRCVQCHRGSPTRNFALGFFPLQIAQRPAATGGTYEPAGDDEVDQLQRLINYGVITGMASPADVAPLEESQAPRHPRTDQELAAQAYMLGNCAHCHNPRGYPSLAKPELASVLNFMPSTGSDGGGVFQFPLDKVSPVRARGAGQDVPMPYITPSLRDYPVADDENYRVDNGVALGLGGNDAAEVTWTPKYSVAMEQTFSVGTDTSKQRLCGNPKPPSDDEKLYCGTRTSGHSFVAAPWRSLIYRNVDSPFPYFDDYVPFPHMPMNTAGFDCRVPQIMAEWMVSLPAVRQNPDIDEDRLPSHGGLVPGSPTFVAYDDSPQPYIEVLPTDPNYPAAVAAAQVRLTEYHSGIRYKYCQDVLGPDIMDPILAPGEDAPAAQRRLEANFHPYHPDPTRYLPGGNVPNGPDGQPVSPAIGVPYHSHWFNYDPTDAPPPWLPRRGTAWYDILVNQIPDQAVPAGQFIGGVPALSQPVSGTPEADDDVDSRRRVVAALGQAELTDDLKKFAKTGMPYGIWQAKPGCESKLAAQKKVSDFTGTARPVWMAQAPAPAADSPVFMMAPGAALYRHICFNCHGPHADGKGLMADALSASSEGQARPANFMAGLFGPQDKPLDNLLQVFGGQRADKDMPTAERWGSRYMAWMALGGTLQLIPKDIIHQVEATRVLGQARPNAASALAYAGSSAVSANMLNLAKGLCSIALPDPTHTFPSLISSFTGGIWENGYPPVSAAGAPFITSNADWEMWMNLCSQFSPTVVRVYAMTINNDRFFNTVSLRALYYGDGPTGYPADADILDHNSMVQKGIPTRQDVASGARPANYYPACLEDPTPLLNPPPDSTAHPLDPAFLQTFQAKSNMPICPPGFLANAPVMWRPDQVEDGRWVIATGVDVETVDRIREWTLRGAAAAGMSVFSYLEDRTSFDPNNPQPYYNQCDLLP